MLLKFSGLFYDEFDPDVELGNSFTNDEKSVTLKDDNSVRLDKEMEKT